MSFTELGFSEADKDVLGAVFASRIALAKKTEDEAAADAREEHRRAIAWVASSSQKEKSFLWLCDIFDLDAGVVRKKIAEAHA